MAEIFRLLKELTTSRTPKKVLVREEARHPITKNVNAISLVKMEKEKNSENNEVVDKNVVELSGLHAIVPKEVVDIEKDIENRANDKLVRNVKEEMIGDGIEEPVEMPRITNEKPVGTNIRLSLAYHSYTFPLGIAEDVLVKIAGNIYSVDFMILDIKEDKKKTFILGTPFLTTAKVEIIFDKGTITLKYGKNKINFFKIPESLCRVEEGTESDIDPVAPNTTVSRLILEWKERIKLHQEKEMKFNQ
ncbi:retrovirus-related pol polyprotein from transposon TNT 1-94 [Tanacetum coccineum]